VLGCSPVDAVVSPLSVPLPSLLSQVPGSLHVRVWLVIRVVHSDYVSFPIIIQRTDSQVVEV
jgi:hypothetical protein